MWAVNSADFWRGGWQLQASFSQSFLLQFWKSQCPSSSKYPEFSKTPPTFAFWMSLKFEGWPFFHKRTFFLRHPVYANQTKCISEFGDVFYNGLYILGPKTFKKLPFLLCHIYGRHCKIRLKMVRMLEKILIVDSAKDRLTMCINQNGQNIVITWLFLMFSISVT